MKQKRLLLKQGVWRAGLVVAISLVVSSVAGAMAVNPSPGDPSQSAWASPTATALRRVGDISSVQHQTNFLSNLDCSSLTYRMVNSSTMQTGCFMPTAFGMVDNGTGAIIFNGTDEAVPLLPYGPHQGIVAWPKALNILSIAPAVTDGDYVSMYKNPLGVLQDNRNASGQLVSKQLEAGPESPLYDAAGRRLLINLQTLAFSDDGSWMVAETLYGRFVRINLATLDVVAFAPAFGSTGSPGLLDSEVAVSDDGRYVAIENKLAESFKVYDLAKCPDPAAGTICQAHEYRPFIDSQINGLKLIKHVRFINDGLLSFEATTSSGTGNGVYELAPTDGITSLTDYLGLGDSYTSGEGAFDYLDGTDTPDNTCHVSANSYPLLLTRDLFGASGGHSVACSGAVINDVGSESVNYHGQVRGSPSLQELEKSPAGLLSSVEADFTPGYVAQHHFVSTYQPRVVTVAIGGNDIGFGGILEACVAPHPSQNTCYNTYEDRLEVMKLIDRTVPRWTALYKQLLAESPASRFYAIGYPQIAVDNGNCALNVRLNKSEIEFSEELITYLNSAIQQAALAAGVPYVDISQALAGHRLCETASYNVAVNGLTAGNDTIGMLGKESYHPTALGQELIEQIILQQTHNLTLASDAPSSNNSGQVLLDAPKTGRTINTLEPNSGMVGETLRQGVSINLSVNGLDDGFRPNANYTIRLDGATGPALATLTTDEIGKLSGQVPIPATTESGSHTLDVIGDNQAGDPIDVRQFVLIVSDSGDTEVCAMINSGQDIDQDGIDDTCDGFIGQPPQTPDVPQQSADEANVTLSAPTFSVVAHFATSNKIGTDDLLDTTLSKPNVGRFTGMGTTAPGSRGTQAVLGAASSRTPVRKGALSSSRQKLPVIGWVHWVVGLIVCWLLVVGIMYSVWSGKLKRVVNTIKI